MNKLKEPIIQALPFVRIYSHRKNSPLAIIYPRQKMLNKLRIKLKQGFAHIGFAALCGFFTLTKRRRNSHF